MGLNGVVTIDRRLCQVCGTCVAGCPSEARSLVGRTYTVEELLELVKKDTLFYRNSGGGVTASGGEPALQAEFVEEFFRQCQRSGLSTALDTCGFVPWEVLERILEFTDLFLYDIKHMNSARHRELTGVDNELILANARRIAGAGKDMIIRLPLIPGYTDDGDNLEEAARFVAEIGSPRVEIAPYHQLGARKYLQLGMEYALSGETLYTEDEVTEIKSRLERYGFEVGIA
jgi:pyruvate formate lyase activating enzyme